MKQRGWGRRWAAMIAAAGVSLAVLVGAPAPEASAVTTAPTADAADFDPGLIITDELFYDGAALSADEIQVFLDDRVSVCRDRLPGRSPYPPPPTCLKDYTIAYPGFPGDHYCAAIPAANYTAAEFIARAGEACGVSQKVLLALLQKEQSLVTATKPTPRQYRAATGYACPDTADCDTRFYGLANQVFMAAWQFNDYAARPHLYGYRAGEMPAIQFHPNASCGAGPVAIQNVATAALYNYTPYQPNQLALDNLYGRGDACSSYGNRNFWRLYTDWFGPTR